MFSDEGHHLLSEGLLQALPALAGPLLYELGYRVVLVLVGDDDVYGDTHEVVDKQIDGLQVEEADEVGQLLHVVGQQLFPLQVND